MPAVLIDGKQIAKQTEASLALRVEALKARGITPGLAVILVGDHPASVSYVSSKEKACARLGMTSRLIHLPETVSQAELASEILRLNGDDAIDGILIQLPLPEHLDTNALLDLIDASKDVDGFHDLNAGRLSKGREGFLPCTPKGILRLLTVSGIETSGKHAVVIGRSNLVGKPAALLLLQSNATVTVCHSHTENLASISRQADILIAAVGRPHFVTADMVKEGTAVIDVGIHRIDGKLTGDVDFDTVQEKASAITPVPGGVGPMTVAMLMENTVEAAERRHRI